MRKIIYGILFALLILSLQGCHTEQELSRSDFIYQSLLRDSLFMEYVKTDMPSPSVEKRRVLWQRTQNDSLYRDEMNKILLPTFHKMLQMHRQLKAKYPEFGPAYVKRYFDEHPLEAAQLIERRGDKPARVASLSRVGFNEDELDDVIILNGCQEAYRYYQSNLSVFGDMYSMIMNSCGSEDTYLRTVYQLLYGIVSPPNSYLSDAFISVGKNYHNLISGGGCETLHSLVKYGGGGDSNGFRFHFLPGLWSATRGSSSYWSFVFEQANICDDIMRDYWGGGGDLYNPKKKAKDILKIPDKYSKDIQILFEKIVKDCLGEGLYDGLISALNGKTIDIEIKGVNGSFNINGNERSISIGTQLDSDQLLHEMFHIFQSYQESTASFGNKLMNVEIEAHYAHYLYLSRQPNYKDSEWEKRDDEDHHRKAVKNLKEFIDEKGNLRTGITEYKLEDEVLSKVIPTFKAHKEYKDYTLDWYRVGLNNFNNLRKITIKC